MFHTPCFFFFFNDTATTEIYTLSLHGALPICLQQRGDQVVGGDVGGEGFVAQHQAVPQAREGGRAHVVDAGRSEEHTSELQSRQYLVCRLLLEKKSKHLNSRLLNFSYANLCLP